MALPEIVCANCEGKMSPLFQVNGQAQQGSVHMYHCPSGCGVAEIQVTPQGVSTPPIQNDSIKVVREVPEALLPETGPVELPATASEGFDADELRARLMGGMGH